MLDFFEKAFGKFYHPLLHCIRNERDIKKIQKEMSLKISSEQIVNPEKKRKGRIYVDMSLIYRNDDGTGIHRVTKNVAANLKELSTNYDVEYVFNSDSWYRKCSDMQKIDFQKDDVFFVLDIALENIRKFKSLFLCLSKNGVKTVYFLHDLIPLRFPKFVERKNIRPFFDALSIVVNFDVIICNSKSTSDDVKNWLLDNKNVQRNKNLKITYSLLGADFSHFDKFKSGTVKSFSSENPVTFLMVSTVEPRKMYQQAVKAFDILWKKNINVRLEIVGRRGWKSSRTFKLIEENPNFSKELVWHSSGINDEELARLYSECDAVLFASIAEGFGLAVAEGAYFKKPLVLRDIPVFREIAGDYAFYFSGESPSDLSSKIEEWLVLYERGLQPKSDNIKLSTWKDCSRKILSILEDEV